MPGPLQPHPLQQAVIRLPTIPELRHIRRCHLLPRQGVHGVRVHSHPFQSDVVFPSGVRRRVARHMPAFHQTRVVAVQRRQKSFRKLLHNAPVRPVRTHPPLSVHLFHRHPAKAPVPRPRRVVHPGARHKAPGNGRVRVIVRHIPETLQERNQRVDALMLNIVDIPTQNPVREQAHFLRSIELPAVRT